MKKLLFFFMSVLFLLGAVACSTPDTKIDNSISEIRLNIYEGRGEVFDVNIFIGKRENPYNLDGYSGKLVDYCLISVMPAEDFSDGELRFTLSGGNYNEGGTLIEDPTNGKFRFDTGKYYADVAEINVTLTVGDITETVIVNAKYSTEMINWKDALGIAKENLSDSFDVAFSGDEFYGEVFIKFVNNPMMGEDKYYWFVMLKDRNGKLSSVLIDSMNREVVAKNVF